MRLEFEGKQHIYGHHLTVPISPLVPDYDESVPDADGQYDDDNLIIHGDNLVALKALMPRYAGRVKCIYIDPPYNTGNENWVYNDNVNSPLMQKWLEDNKPVDGEDLERHDKWLCMMWPRLHLLRELLTDDGVICISCDDTELSNLISIMNEIFGEKNKEEIICWRRRHNQPNDKSKPIAKTTEFIVVYSKNLERLKELKSFNGISLSGNFSNPDNDPRGPWASKPWKSGSNQTGTRYTIVTPTGVVHDEEWLGTELTYQELYDDGRITFSRNGRGLPRKKYYKSERALEGQAPHNFWSHEEFGSNQEASSELNELGVDFSNPKPSRLLATILQIFSNPGDIVLDSFAGSGTLAHAARRISVELGDRKFILVECEDYADTITAERVRRVIRGVPDARDDILQEGYGGSFTFCTLGEPLSVSGMLRGESLPSYRDMAAYTYYTATGRTIDPGQIDDSEGEPFYKDMGKDFWLLYKPDLEWLRSSASALNEELAKRISGVGNSAVVFASHKHLTQRSLSDMGIVFCQLPYEGVV